MAAQLISLPEVERLSPTCIRILGGNSGKFTLQGTNTYLLGTGSTRLLIDTGEGKPSWIAALKKTLADEQATIKSALLTHWHHDHIQGAGDLLEHSPDTAIYKCDPHEGWLDIKDGQTFEVEGATLTAVYTPGHTTDHMAFVLRDENALFTGDNVLGYGTAVFEDLGTYLRSLEKMEKLDDVKGRAYPGHGPVIRNAKTTIREYISHRREREDQVLQTLTSWKAAEGSRQVKGWTAMDLVKFIYKDYPESLFIPAMGGVVQILRKLQAEKKVVLLPGKDDRWSLEDRSSL
ncbi:metallo-beta-lactamase domain-containing protein [Pseudomassariella vexata]|uniref:Metallo-beta-lactamase domain-containing protein n=1 Tax=Pseudomassariella vexata TaxID=1141098 RepID=A0A1Y2DNI5_9PEZI|nr:metallo-beta-lactamase domain-containing protein [Pseudomassariella vexata]ORY60724.1 metallo-beta-lactamase domain-containing protein [Pseudomassariella vexata]